MKRLVIGLLLAATAYAPFAATAQRREQNGAVTDDVDRTEAREQRRAARQERRAARVEAGAAVQAPTPDRPRRDRAEVARPDPGIDRGSRPQRDGLEPRPDGVDRPDRPRRADRRDAVPEQRLLRPEDSLDYGANPRRARLERQEDRRESRRDRLNGDSRFRDDRELGRGDRFDDRRNDGRFDGRGADRYRGGPVWNRGWRNDDRYDWNRARLRDRNAFRLPRYYAPPGAGYGYRRFGPGFQLSRSLFARDYWLDDPFAYRLPPAYGPYRWVRYHGDALLVDLRTGRVIDAVYDIFY